MRALSRVLFRSSLLVLASPLAAAGVGDCNPPSHGPDVIVGNVTGVRRWGTVGDLTGYSIGTDACNVGDEVLPWTGNGTNHPLIAQNMYRLVDGRFEQVGMSWLKHGFAAAALSNCCPCTNPGSPDLLGIGCSDPYDASTNGDQDGAGGVVGGLGPRSEVDPTTGSFLWPYGGQGLTGDAIYRRCQVRNADLDPALNLDAFYFAEVQYVTPQDAAAANHLNNVSHRRIKVGDLVAGGYELSIAETTQRTEPAIYAWRDREPEVELTVVDVPNDGRFIVGAKVTELGGGVWHYEYALYDQCSKRAAGAVSVPLPAGVAAWNLGFHDVDSHSGEPYSTEDWTGAVGANAVEWTTEDYALDPNANALRWGTLYNVRFDASAPPQPGSLSLALFEPGSPSAVQVALPVPGDSPCVATSYCSVAPNSVGAGARLSALGSTSVGANELRLRATGCTPSQHGLFFYGPNATQVPFGDGFLCVSGGAHRLNPPSAASSQGELERALDFGAPPMARGPGAVLPGSTWRFQLWYRDPTGPGGTGFNLSDALAIRFCP